jgi:hypothetical protein
MYELAALRSSLGGLEPRTPTQLIALGSAGTPLAEHLVALSVSEPSEEELASQSLRRFHVSRAFVEIARHLLAAGASLAYGGNLAAHRDQHRNVLELLLDLVAAYDLPGRPDRDRIRNYQLQSDLAALAIHERAWINAVATLIPVEDDGADTAAAFTKMRGIMTRECDARVVLGGKLHGFAGLLPGVAEEALQAIRAHKPLFVLGGFGGAARAIRDLLLGVDSPELGVEHQDRFTPSVASAVSGSHRSRLAVEQLYADLTESLHSAGTAALNNGLAEEDNLALMYSDDVEVCAILVLRGLVASLRAT